jgi:glutathione S-transferase
MAEDIVLYRSIATRSFTALWMLEELGLPYRMETFDSRTGQTRSPEYLALNPAGQVPMVVDGGVKITELPAICLYLADRHSYGELAPRIEDPARAAYLKWMVWSTAVLEPSSTLADREVEVKRGDWGFGFSPLEREVELLAEGLEQTGYLATTHFTAADVAVGSVLAMRLHTGQIPSHPILAAYNARNRERPAFQRAEKINWPPELFGAS